jgi:hypothetical protein
MTTTFKQIVRGLALAAALTGGAHAATLTLEQLFNGGTLTVGDKLFDRFSLVTTGPLGGPLPASSDGRLFDASRIDVETLADNGYGFGIGFNIKDRQLDVTGDGIYAFADYSFEFRVRALDPTLGIVGAAMGFDPGFASLTWQVDGSNDLGAFIKESIGSTQGGSDISNDLTVDFSVLDDVQTRDFPNDVSFGPVSELWVTKNINVWSQDSTDTASLQGFSQRFAQAAMPEPTTYALVGIALLAAGAAGRRRPAPTA